MCRFIFLYKCKDAKEKMIEFLQKKYSHEHATESSYGVAWYKCGEWNEYKSIVSSVEDPNYSKVIEQVNSDILILHVRYILHMPKHKYMKENIIENAHPFFYKNYVFVHTGDLFYSPLDQELMRHQSKSTHPEFKSVMKKLSDHISPFFKKQIKGKTDSEIIFYLMLTVETQLQKVEGLSKEKLFLYSFIKTIQIIDYYSIDNISNFFFSNGKYIIVANILKKTPRNKRNKLDLYMNHGHSGEISASNKKIRDSCKEVKENNIYLLHISSGALHHIELPDLKTFHGGGGEFL